MFNLDHDYHDNNKPLSHLLFSFFQNLINKHSYVIYTLPIKSNVCVHCILIHLVVAKLTLVPFTDIPVAKFKIGRGLVIIRYLCLVHVRTNATIVDRSI